MSRCYCPECEKLDQLPVRRQGIPGAWQTTFDHVHQRDEIDWPVIEEPYRSHGPRNRQVSADSLPLFVGSLEPTLF